MGQIENYAIVVAAGRGARARREMDGTAKQYVPLAGKPILWHTLSTFEASPDIAGIVTVIHPDDMALYETAVGSEFKKLMPVAIGGATRQASVLNGLEALNGCTPDVVFIHDAVRPFCSPALLRRLTVATKSHKAVIPVLPVVDTLKQVTNNSIEQTVPRETLCRAQTPQCFKFDYIIDAHRRAAREETCNFTDDASIAEWDGERVHCVEGEERNIKITTQGDFKRAEMINGGGHTVRVGQGYDVHAFGPGSSVMLCGVEIAHNQTLVGHSDADVGLHAITDAVYGALGAGDIGRHFPPSDPQWRGANSRVFLEHAVGLAKAQEADISNVDVTLICEEPKIGPHAEEMIATVATIMSIDPERVSIKATTTEKLGSLGRGEGIAAMALVTLQI